ncbi:MAG: phosphotransferase [Gammaproteobacteria bacterium]
MLKYAQTFDGDLTSLEPLKIEASGRKYYRVSSQRSSYVISHDDSEVNGQLVFINRANELSDYSVRVPKIYQYEVDSNLTVLEDLGDHSLIDEKNFYQQEGLVHSSLKLLNQMHQARHVDLHSTFWMGLESHSKKFSKIFCKDFLGLDMFDGYKDLYVDMRPQIMDQQWTNCHFDFERRNIHLLDNGDLALIDFQDMCFGPIGIDLAGILIDHYIPCKIDILKRYCISFSELSIYDLSPEDIFSATLWGGLQRNLRIMGTLTALYLQFNRSFRMNDLPQIALNTAIISKELNQLSLANFLNDNVSQALEDKLTYL